MIKADPSIAPIIYEIKKNHPGGPEVLANILRIRRNRQSCQFFELTVAADDKHVGACKLEAESLLN